MTQGSSNGGTIVNDHLGAIPPHTLDLDRRRRLGHDDHGADAESLRDQRHRLTMIAGGVGDDARGARLGRQLRNHVAGTAHLERTHRLQVFALERQRADLEERRSHGHPTDPHRGRPDVIECDHRVRV
jgi:hypothetical protein